MPAASTAAPREIAPAPAAVVEALGLSPPAAVALESYGAMLAQANRRMNLVGAGTLGDFWGRHVLDCGQLLGLAPGARRWADLGSGGGLPGIVLAILLAGAPGARVDLIESVGKRARFLRGVVGELRLPAVVHEARAETLAIAVDVVAARACAPLARLLGHARGFLGAGARGLFLKGEGAAEEIAVARRTWRFDCEVFPSLSDPRGRILRISGLEPRRGAA